MDLDEFLKKRKNKGQNCKKCTQFRYLYSNKLGLFIHYCNKKLKLFLPCKSFKKSKLGSIKTIIDKIEFDSKKEASRYRELKWQEQNGLITKFETQPKFILQEKYVNCADCKKRNNKQIKSRFKCEFCGSKKVKDAEGSITYKADFKIFNLDGSVVIEDTKGYETERFKINRKLLLYKYPEIILKIG